MNPSLGILSLYFYFNNKGKTKIIALFAFIFALISTFYTQERSGMGLFIIFSCILFYIYLSDKSKIFIIVASFIGLLLILDDLSSILSLSNVGRFSKITEFDNVRQQLVINALSFIEDNWLLGGSETYDYQYGLVPHNVLLHAFVYGGVIGGTLILYLTAYLLYDTYKVFRFMKYNPFLTSVASSLAIYLLNGFFHSSSLISGDFTIWMLYGILNTGIWINNKQPQRI